MRSEQEALELVRAKARAIRRRRWMVGTAGGAAMLVVVVLAATLQTEPSSSVDVAGSDTTSTTTSTTAAPAEPVPAPGDPSGQPGGAPDGPPAPLQIQAVVLDEPPLIDTDVRFRITVTDGDGSLTSLTATGHDLYTGIHPPDPLVLGSFPECGTPGPSTTTLDVTVPMMFARLPSLYQVHRGMSEHISLDRLPSLPNPMTFVATTRSGCDGGETAEITVPVVLHYGNGPTPPRRVFPEGADGGDIHPIWSGDCDGVLDRIEVDWGDGTSEVFDFNIYGCNHSPSSAFEMISHKYPAPGTYTITAVAFSTDDQGQNEQRSEVSTLGYTYE